jgi:hypothetical protein
MSVFLALIIFTKTLVFLGVNARDCLVDPSRVSSGSPDGSESNPFKDLEQLLEYFDQKCSEEINVIVMKYSDPLQAHLITKNWEIKCSKINLRSLSQSGLVKISFGSDGALSLRGGTLAIFQISLFFSDNEKEFGSISLQDGSSLELNVKEIFYYIYIW